MFKLGIFTRGFWDEVWRLAVEGGRSFEPPNLPKPYELGLCVRLVDGRTVWLHHEVPAARPGTFQQANFTVRADGSVEGVRTRSREPLRLMSVVIGGHEVLQLTQPLQNFTTARASGPVAAGEVVTVTVARVVSAGTTHEVPLYASECNCHLASETPNFTCPVHSKG
jgi:hypothetical protein